MSTPPPQQAQRTDLLFRATDLGGFVRLFLAMPQIRVYLALVALLAIAAVGLARGAAEVLLPVIAVVAVYPFYEYALHRWVLHMLALCRNRVTARIWWRMHFRHHAEPADAGVIFASPPMLLVAAAFGAAIVAAPFGSIGALMAAAAAALAVGILYEFAHALAHAQVPLAHPFLARMRRHHLIHHHVADERNFGILTDAVDRLAGTVASAGDGRSPTAYTLGYDGEVVRAYPFVADYDRDRAETDWLEPVDRPKGA